MKRLRELVLAVCVGAAAPAAAQSEAIALAVQDNWAAAEAAAVDPLTRDLVTWLRLRDSDSAADFSAYAAFTARRGDWPGIDRLRARGEERIAKGHDPAAVIAWFAEQSPETGEGAVRLAEAYYASGEPELAAEVIETAWVDLRLSESGHNAMIAAFPDILTPLHMVRTDTLLWRWRTDEAARMLPLLSEDAAKLAAARIAFIRKAGNVGEALAAVPATLRDDPGLAYDRYNWLADRGERTQAVALLRQRSVSEAALGEPFRWSGWRRSLARWEMREGRADVAYALASQHFLDDGAAFADLEWLAGYLSLTYLDAAEQALTHFQRARAAVDSPISVGRMAYWTARALDDLGRGEEALVAYREASAHQTGFYGLLAAEKLGLSLDPDLTGAGDMTNWQNSPVMEKEMVRAALLLLDGGARGPAVLFFAELGKTLPRDDLSRLGALLVERGESYYAVLLGKTAVTRGVVVPSIYFPLHDLADMELPVDASLALSIARRESEFNAGVGSPVGALGLMQLMPATAQEVAGFEGLSYSRGRLTSDWRYNARLGSAYLKVLQDQFGPSPVQIAAGYNAGPSRPETWMDERGDPRLGEVDVIDWIEHIPFRETRNYVMRVTESIPVYKARLTGRAGPIAFTRLLIGEKPIVRPLARNEAVPPPPTPTVSTSDVPVAPVRSLRPAGRPEG